MGSKDVRTLANLTPGDYITLSLPGFDEPTKWHVNNAPRIGGGGDVTISVILQKGDASEHWLVAFIKQTAGKSEWVLDQFVEFKGHPPSGLEPGDHGKELNFAEVAIESVEQGTS